MVRADCTQIVSIFPYALIHESVVTSDVDASIRFEWRTEFVIIEKRIGFIMYEQIEALRKPPL